MAGLDVLRLHVEPTLGAVARFLKQPQGQKTTGLKKVLVFDLGGGTFDVSVVVAEDGI